jgi:hypothetical protein
LAERITAAARLHADASWQELARRAVELKGDSRKDYNQSGRGARDLYKKTLEVAAKEMLLQKRLKNELYAGTTIETCNSQAKKLQAKEKVSA